MNTSPYQDFLYSSKWRLLSILLLLPSLLVAQQLRGTVYDQDSGDPLPFASVAMLSQSDSTVIQGMTTDKDGFFSLSRPASSFILEVNYISYKVYYLNIDPSRDDVEKPLIIHLQSDSEMLKEVTVTGMQSMFRSEIDKRVYTVENSIVAQGGTAIDVLETLPSIQVDEEGGITMRGSGNILILINGRPSTVSSDDTESILSQFPANSIKSIELITNPSARYDAAGVGGIINIILKEDNRRGLNGQVEVGAGTRNKYNGGLNLSYNYGKLRAYSSYNYQYRELYEISESQRFARGGNASHLLDQTFDTWNANVSHLAIAGLEYQVAPSIVLGGRFQGGFRSRDRLRTYEQDHIAVNNQRDSLVRRILSEDQRSINYESTFTFDWQIDSVGQSLSAFATYTTNQQERIELFNEDYFYGNSSMSEKTIDQIYGRPDSSTLIIIQSDYILPVRQGSFEAGIKSTISRRNEYNLFSQLDPITGQYVNNDSITNTFNFDEDIHALYANYRNQYRKIGYQIGLRGEWTINESLEGNNQTKVPNNYFNLFPSAYLTYDIGTNQQLLANYSRRISRPGTWQLAPVYNAQDLLNLRLGNPFLQPEITDSYEVGYNMEGTWQLFTGTVYHRRASDVLTRVFLLHDNNQVVQFWDNANDRIASGMELINQFTFTKQIDATLSTNLFYSEIRGQIAEEAFVNSAFSWTVSLLSNIRLHQWGTFQITGNYRGPIVLPQGLIDPLWGINIGYRKNLMDNKLSVGVNLSDVFNTRVFRISTNDALFDQRRIFDGETQIGSIYLRYNFGYQQEPERRKVRDDLGDDPF